MKPIIGITCGTQNKNSIALHSRYCEAIDRAGGIPLLIPPYSHPDTAFSVCDGILLSGGGDICPRLYGVTEYDAARLSDPDPVRDKYEIGLAKLAVAGNKPLLGICRGIQVLNVALGGTLHFDIANHMQKADKDQPTHRVSLKSSSKLRALFNQNELHTNSLHHQAVCTPAMELDITGISDDGIIEALEAPGNRFLIGVQWHPEHMDGLESHILFAAFCKAAGCND